MFVHKIQIILNLLYVCQSVIWLTALLKLWQYRDISSSIFLILFGDIARIFLDYSHMTQNVLFVCQSVSWLAFLLKLGQYRDILSSG